jgi:CDP-2,3-bis-(O-geranylgeranyl)-sn-glycerol synthase
MLLHNLFTAVWIFLPAALSNTPPVIAAKTPILKDLNYPMDFGKSIKGKRILGKNKTIRGLVIGVLTSILVAYSQKHLYINTQFIKQALLIPNYESINILLFGILSGLGGILGDAAKSFIKRQKGIKPGTSWVPFDQVDYVIGGLVFIYPVVQISPLQVMLIFVIFSFLHPLTTMLGHLLGLKESPI